MPTTLSQKAMRVKPSSTLAITAKAKALKAQGHDIVSFGAGEPDFDTPENICQAGIEAIKTGQTKYTPASGTSALRRALCEKFASFNGLEYSEGQIIVSNGGKHSLTNTFEAILNPGDEVIIPAPFWLSYPEIVRLADGVPVFVQTNMDEGYKLTPKKLEEAITPKTKALILCSPSNPTGAVYVKEELEAIAQIAIRHDFFIVSDEMYEMLVYDGLKHTSMAALGREIYERTITISGVSKSYAMTGWRIGYAAAPLHIAKCMSSIQSHQTSHPCSVAQAAALEAVSGPQDKVHEMVGVFDERRKYIYDRVCALENFSVVRPQGAFYIFTDCSRLMNREYNGKNITQAADIAKILIDDYKVAVIPCADFGAPFHIRLSYAISKEEIAKGMDRIGEFLSSPLLK